MEKKMNKFELIFSTHFASSRGINNTKMVVENFSVSIAEDFAWRKYDINEWYVGRLKFKGMNTLSCDRLKEIIDKLDPKLKGVAMGDSMDETKRNLVAAAQAISDHIKGEEPSLNLDFEVEINNERMEKIHDAAANEEASDNLSLGMSM